jgi:hypothetical protein
LTVAALEVHMSEEYLMGFGPAMSRLFDISWTERSFLLTFAFAGPAIYALTAIGLYYRIAFAGFVAWFIFIGPGVAEFTHFIFPLLKPALSPTSDRAVLLSWALHRSPSDDSGHLGDLPLHGPAALTGREPCAPGWVPRIVIGAPCVYACAIAYGRPEHLRRERRL